MGRLEMDKQTDRQIDKFHTLQPSWGAYVAAMWPIASRSRRSLVAPCRSNLPWTFGGYGHLGSRGAKRLFWADFLSDSSTLWLEGFGPTYELLPLAWGAGTRALEYIFYYIRPSSDMGGYGGRDMADMAGYSAGYSGIRRDTPEHRCWIPRRASATCSGGSGWTPPHELLSAY
jgi:hypothetical protein